MMNIVRIKIFYSSYCLLFLFWEGFNKGNKISVAMINQLLIMVIGLSGV